jgi:hypothetical protein
MRLGITNKDVGIKKGKKKRKLIQKRRWISDGAEEQVEGKEEGGKRDSQKTGRLGVLICWCLAVKKGLEE